MSALRDIMTAMESAPHGSAALEYNKGAHATGEGDRYEERVLALVFLRCLSRGLIFQLSANNGDAGKFDDVALVWRPEGLPEAHTLLVQLKHKTAPKSMTIHSWMWLSKAVKCDFGLRKYCISFGEISNSIKMDRVTLVLMTNACLGDSSHSLFERQEVVSVPGLELLKAGGELYRLNPTNQQVWEAVCGNTSFVEHFYLLCQQRNYTEIVNDIYIELEVLLGAGDHCRYICDCLFKSIREWMNEKSVCFTRGWNSWQAILDEYVRKEVTACRVLTTRLDYCSVEGVWDHIESCNPAWVRPLERGTGALCATKIHQALGNRTHIMVAVERFRELRHRILPCWGPFCQWLVIVDSDKEDNSEIFSELETQIQAERHLVIVSSLGNNCFMDTCKSSDISDASWEELMAMDVRLNGEDYECRLQDLVAGVDGLKSVLDGSPSLLLALARLSQPLRMGQQLETLPEYYVPRKLVSWRLMTDEFFKSLGVWDVCVVDSKSYEPLSRKLDRHSVMTLAEVRRGIVNPHRYVWPLFVVTDNLQTVQEEYRSWEPLNAYILQISDGGCEVLYFSTQTDRFTEYSMKQEKDQLEAFDTSNIIIVEGRPGVGKSKMLSHVAKELKERDSSCWLLRVNLLEFYTVLDKTYSGVYALEDVLRRTVLNKDELGELEYALLRCSLLLCPRVICLVDGFDEVCPDYVEKCLEMLCLLSPKKGKLVVTTRPAQTKPLQAQMGVLAYSLEPFSDSELLQFFTNHPSYGDSQRITRLNKSLRDLLRIPLFAEIFASLSLEVAAAYDIVTLYEAFFQNKFRRLYEEKLGDNLSAPGKKREIEDVQKRHEEQLMLLATSVLLGSTDLPRKVSLEWEYFVKVGIVYEFADGKPAFLHRTFAEHFLAKWCFVRDGEQSRAAVYCDAYREGTLEIFLQSFDHRAARGRPLLEAVLAGDKKKVSSLLDTGADPMQTDTCGRNALHLAAASGFPSSLSLLKQLTGCMGKDKLSAEDGLLGWTPMRYAAERGDSSTVLRLMEETGGDLSHIGDFVVQLHDASQLQALHEQEGYQALYQHVSRVNNPKSKGLCHPSSGRRREAVQIQFVLSLISANMPGECLKLINKEAWRERHKMVHILLNGACYRSVVPEKCNFLTRRRKDQAERAARLRHVPAGGERCSAPEEDQH